MPKKDFTKGDNAIDRFFNKNETSQTKHTNNTNITNNTNHTKHLYDYDITHNTTTDKINPGSSIVDSGNITIKVSKARNKSKHYDERGPRTERLGLLLDKRLRDDLSLLSKILGSRSVNDLINTVLLEYVEKEDNQAKLKQFKELL